MSPLGKPLVEMRFYSNFFVIVIIVGVIVIVVRGFVKTLISTGPIYQKYPYSAASPKHALHFSVFKVRQ